MNLINALKDANLRGADLSEADLSEADLSEANLRGAEGKFALFYGGKHHAIATASSIIIGCERHPHEYWRENFAPIGKANDYTDAEIERYRAWIFSLDWLIAK